MSPSLIKSKGVRAEQIVLEYLANQGYKVWRVPMSLLPFDILAVDVKNKEIRFIEVKTLKSKLSPRQKMFAELIEQLDNPSICFDVAVVTDKGEILFCHYPLEECRNCPFNDICDIYRLKGGK